MRTVQVRCRPSLTVWHFTRRDTGNIKNDYTRIAAILDWDYVQVRPTWVISFRLRSIYIGITLDFSRHGYYDAIRQDYLREHAPLAKALLTSTTITLYSLARRGTLVMPQRRQSCMKLGHSRKFGRKMIQVILLLISS